MEGKSARGQKKMIPSHNSKFTKIATNMMCNLSLQGPDDGQYTATTTWNPTTKLKGALTHPHFPSAWWRRWKRGGSGGSEGNAEAVVAVQNRTT